MISLLPGVGLAAYLGGVVGNVCGGGTAGSSLSH